MDWIKIHMKDGSIQEFKERGRSGGSYTITIKYEGGMAIVIDEYYKTVAIPINDIQFVETAPIRPSW